MPEQVSAGAGDTHATIPLLILSVAGQRYALPLSSVDRVIQAVELRSLPRAPRVVRGVFSLHGEILPVVDLRRRLDLPERQIALNDWIVVARTPSRRLGILAEGEADLEECKTDDIVATEDVLGGEGLFEGIAQLPSGLVLIQNLAKFLSIDDERALAEALNA